MKSLTQRLGACACASVFLLGVLVALVATSPSVAASITGDTYGGSGNFVVTQNTVYDGTNLNLHGNMYVAQTISFTLRNAVFTMDEATVGQFGIFLNWTSSFNLKYATFTTTPDFNDGHPYAKLAQSVGNPEVTVLISNSTVSHLNITPAVSMWASLDNSSFHASSFRGAYNGGGTVNISTNTFRDYRGNNLITSSALGTKVTANTFTNITQTEGNGAHRAMITITGDGTTGNVSILKNHFDVVEIGGVKVWDVWNAHISRNYFHRLTSTAENTAGTEGIAAWAEGVHDSGLYGWGSIDNNTFELCEGAMHNVGTTAIGVGLSAAHWIVADNSIWTVHKPVVTGTPGNASTGISLSGSLLYALRNHIGNVSMTGPDADTAGGQSHGIGISGTGSISGPFTTTYVYAQHNTIDLVSNSTVGIEVRYMCRYIEVSNNTIGMVRGYDSSGIGVYNEPRDILIAYNTLTMTHDVWGINLAHNHTYATVTRNHIHVVDVGTYHDEGIYEGVRGGGAIAVNDEADAVYLPGERHWTATGDLLLNNTITHEPSTDYVPDYAILGCYRVNDIGAPGQYLKIVLDHGATIMANHSYFRIQGVMVGRVVDNGSVQPITYTEGNETWFIDMRLSPDMNYISVTLSDNVPNWGPGFAVIGFVWVAVFAILGGAGLLVYLRYALDHGD